MSDDKTDSPTRPDPGDVPLARDSASSSGNRRTVLAALITGGAAVVTPLAAGVAAFLSPLFRKTKPPTVRVALLSQVPDDGQPRLFPVATDRQDAWNLYPDKRVGSVFLIRNNGDAKPKAFSAKCPHAGCFIGYAPGDNQFKCPCHTSSFHLDGTRVSGDREVSPRDMDQLEVSVEQVAADGEQVEEVRVKYVDYQTGHKEQIPST